MIWMKRQSVIRSDQQPMKSKSEIVTNWLPRYTDTPLEEFGKYILLTNFISYVHAFARMEGADVRGLHRPMQTATSADGHHHH